MKRIGQPGFPNLFPPIPAERFVTHRQGPIIDRSSIFPAKKVQSLEAGASIESSMRKKMTRPGQDPRNLYFLKKEVFFFGIIVSFIM